MGVKIELLKPHRHAGRDYPAGGVIAVDPDQAAWLVGIGVAKEAGADKPQAEPQTGARSPKEK